MSGPRLSVALTREVSPCKGCTRDVAKPECHDWCWEYWKWKQQEEKNKLAKREYAAKPWSKIL